MKLFGTTKSERSNMYWLQLGEFRMGFFAGHIPTFWHYYSSGLHNYPDKRGWQVRLWRIGIARWTNRKAKP